MQQDEYETESESEREDQEENVTLRLKPYKMIPANRKKGSNKVLCSLVSVGLQNSIFSSCNFNPFLVLCFQDIETTYIPGMSELTDENFIHIPLQLRNASDTLIDCLRVQKTKFESNFRVSC